MHWKFISQHLYENQIFLSGIGKPQYLFLYNRFFWDRIGHCRGVMLDGLPISCLFVNDQIRDRGIT